MTDDRFFDTHGALTPRGLAAARRNAKMSQSQLATLVGRSSISISRWERGIASIPGTLYPLLPTVLGLDWPPPLPPIGAEVAAA